MVLAQEILPRIHEVPVFVAVGLGVVRPSHAAGDGGVGCATRHPVCRHRSIAHPDFKRAFIHAAARCRAVSATGRAVPVIPVRGWSAGGQALPALQARRDRFEIRRTEQGGGAARDRALLGRALIARRSTAIETGSVMAGQSVGMVTAEQPTAEIIAELVAQAVAALLARNRTG
jgi:enoyl-[acyl-carrier protein] reductase II